MSDILYRQMQLSVRAGEETNAITFSASSETPVLRYGDQEILVHTPEAVRLDRLLSLGALLVNHDPDQRAGAIDGARIEGGQLIVDARFLSTAFGQEIKTEAEEGSLRGVSVGYRVHSWEYNEDTREAKAVDWEVYEISLTPIPADASVGVGRSENITLDQWHGVTGRTQQAASAAVVTEKEPEMAEEQKPPERNAADETKIRELEQRAERAEMRSIIAMRASEHGIVIDEPKLDSFRSQQDGMDHILKEMASRSAQPELEAGPIVTVGEEDFDKKSSVIVDAMEDRFGLAEGENKGLRGASVLEIGRRWLQAQGKAVPASRVALANVLIQRDAANVTTGDFTSYIMANTMSKAIMKGYGAARSTYQLWTERRMVPDFKTFTGAALDRGNLVQTAENVAFPELGKAEDGYSDSLKMWGVTVSLSQQALVNDDLGEFMKLIRQAGAIAAKTIEKQVYTEVNGATWTNHTTVTGALGTAGNLAKGVAAYMNRSGPAGEKIDIEPMFLLVPAGLYEDALKVTTSVQGATSAVVNSFLTPVITPHLTTAATAANSTYYLAAERAMADNLIVSFLEGADTPMLQEYDAGAVAARKWKIMLPFETTLPAGLVGLHQCTQA